MIQLTRAYRRFLNKQISRIINEPELQQWARARVSEHDLNTWVTIKLRSALGAETVSADGVLELAKLVEAHALGGLRTHCKATTATESKKKKPPRLTEKTKPDWTKKCTVCGATPIVPVSKMCGPCTFGEADTAGGNW
jgi:hypothetical protein